MAVAIKSLAKGQVSTTQQAVYTTATGKAALVKNMRFVNTATSGTSKINAFFKRGSNSYRILDKDKDIVSGATGILVDADEFCLEADDRIELVVDTGTVDYVISGIERDQ